MYLISDTHFSHAKIIEYENRPFKSIEDMNDRLIENWNSVISKRDTVWHLGDFCFGNKEMIKNIVPQLNGRIHLVLGNHDGTHAYQWWLDCGFEFVSKHPVIYEGRYILSHEPTLYDIGSGFYNIHGHIHGRENDLDGRYFNVSAEVLNYTPIDFIIVKKKLENIEDNSNLCPECGKPLISEWSGIKCSVCDYWFCF